jgi:hypothetical protein
MINSVRAWLGMVVMLVFVLLLIAIFFSGFHSHRMRAHCFESDFVVTCGDGTIRLFSLFGKRKVCHFPTAAALPRGTVVAKRSLSVQERAPDREPFVRMVLRAEGHRLLVARPFVTGHIMFDTVWQNAWEYERYDVLADGVVRACRLPPTPTHRFGLDLHDIKVGGQYWYRPLNLSYESASVRFFYFALVLASPLTRSLDASFGCT